MSKGLPTLGDILAAALRSDAPPADEGPVVTFEYLTPPPVVRTVREPAPLVGTPYDPTADDWFFEVFDHVAILIAEHYGLDVDDVSDAMWEFEAHIHERFGWDRFGALLWRKAGACSWQSLGVAVAIQITGLPPELLPPPLATTLH